MAIALSAAVVAVVKTVIADVGTHGADSSEVEEIEL